VHAPTQRSRQPGHPGRRSVLPTLVICALVVAWLATASGFPGGGLAIAQEGPIDARVGSGAPGSWDPAQAGDVTTAAVLSQVFVGLTEFDANSNVQPGLARSWSVEQGGKRIVFQLRDGLRFSDGSPLTAQDVTFSWLRLLDPAHRSPLASLLDDVAGAAAYGRGQAKASDVGVRADGNKVIVDLRRPASYFVSITGAAPLAVVSRNSPPPDTKTLPAKLVISGAYQPAAQTETTIELEANANYWAGKPPLARIRLVTDLKGKNPVAAFDDGDMDVTGVQAFDAAWLRYDRDIGSRLREVPSFGVFYYGFDTTRAPFNDRRVRQAFAQAVDWNRLVRLADPTAVPATSLLPAGLPGRSPTNFMPAYDPAAARAALASAGYPEGRGFPSVTLVSGGSNYDGGVLHELKQNLGVTVGLETMAFDEYFERLGEDAPQFWNLSWIADYPAPQDFLGLLAESGSDNNYGHWSNSAYDAAITAAAGTSDATEQRRHYDEAQKILRDEAALIPVSYGQGWGLSSDQLLGANQSGVGFLRLAGLKWSNR
jgi:oligopeptide transport system substrate-binding protein